MLKSDKAVNPASWRDPSGFIFNRDGIVYRQVNDCYRDDYLHLLESGLYRRLTEAGLLIKHEDAPSVEPVTPDAYGIIRPQQLDFISFPYEWCFSQLKDAALTTLRIQSLALEHGMTLKDASSYNIQFVDNRSQLIDSLSFERYIDGTPWIAYRQFCQHFLAPLALSATTGLHFGRVLQLFLDGVPLDRAAKLLPWWNRFKPGLAAHIHLHARSIRRHQSDNGVTSNRRFSGQAFAGLIDNLTSTIRNLSWRNGAGEWSDYYDTNSYSAKAFAHKKEVVSRLLAELEPGHVWDLGANTGVFSRLAADRGANVIAWDADPSIVESNYRSCRENGETRILPLVIDLTNPSPAIGWAHRERLSMTDRSAADTVMALALIHHLAIGNNVPLEMIAAWMGELGNNLIVEFVPKSDPQVQRLLASRRDIFNAYHQDGFEAAFAGTFRCLERIQLHDSDRLIYLMQLKNR
jgi:ribosomal protein L11 methylase PrmA